MANFLEAFKACIESFFTAKKGFIAEQSSPSSLYSTQTFYGISNYQNYVAPIDGYLCVQTYSETSRIGIQRSDMLFTASTGNGQGTVGAIFPIKKGDSFGIWVSTNVQYDMRYFNKVGLC